ncbi:SDR family oxidoreductase [Tabrizicola sp.]|uniref:SDR family oxidoreductase n=1 Tax=Tabrizicola sp. TaxID=2005166 RepID=UPI002FDEC292
MTRVLVTGATSGIGRAMAEALHAAGYQVLALGRNAQALAELAAGGIETMALDLSDPLALAALRDRPVDVLINNAGVIPKPGPFVKTSATEIDDTLAVNLASVLHLTQAIVPGMIARGAGHVVFTGSTAAHAPGANFAVYAASKAGIAAFAAALRAELSPHGIRVTELVPGRVETGLYSAVLPDAARGDMYADGNSLQPQDLADALLAVLSLPTRASVTRLDILPTRPVPAIQLK